MVDKLLNHMTWKRLQLLTVDLTTPQAIKGWLTCLYLLSAQDKHLSLGVLINTVSLPSLHFHKGSRLPLGTQTFVGLKRPHVLLWLGSTVGYKEVWDPLCHGEASHHIPEMVWVFVMLFLGEPIREQNCYYRVRCGIHRMMQKGSSAESLLKTSTLFMAWKIGCK